VQSLRGLAALTVLWFHFTNGNPNFLPDGPLKSSGSYGWLGVDVFFVISGFVLPYSLFSAGYQTNPPDYLRFVLKRITRLDPPYLVSIGMVIALAYVSTWVPGYRGAEPAFSSTQVLLHLGYLNGFTAFPWLNVVYWSLAIEFQYYLLIGLIFPFLNSHNPGARIIAMLALGLSAILVPNGSLVFHYFFLFIMGFAAFWSRAGLVASWGLVFAFAFGFLGSIWTLGGPSALAGLLTAIAIVWVNATSRPLAFLGDLSYSLYLVHVPVGGRVINFGERMGGGLSSKVVWLALAIGTSLFASWLLFRFVEDPCRRFAGSIRVRPSCS
jgi:peptidoglycan/LPS O-acetylase OafA/YrhL